jgi:hypothetical protein
MKMNQIKSYVPLLGISLIFAIPSTRSAAIDWNTVGIWALDWLRAFATFLFLGLLAIWIIPKPLNRWSEVVRRSPLKSFGAGILVVIVGYAGIILLIALVLALGIFLIVLKLNDLGSAVLTLGLPAVGLLLGALNFTIAFVSKLVVIFFLGKILLERVSPKALKHNFWPLLLGLVIYLLLRAIPWLGWGIGVVVTLIGLGAIWLGLSRPKSTSELASDPELDTAVENSSPAEATAEIEAAAGMEQAQINPLSDELANPPGQESKNPGSQPGSSDDSQEVDPQVGD